MHSYKADIDYLVLDGIPRNVNQAKIMSEFIDVVQVFHLSCPDRAELAHRMRKRALKENRLDDANETVVQKRIATYEAETKPILDYYPKSIVKDIDATKLPLQVLNDITSTILGLPGYQERASISQ
jgi:adenylate kinase